MLHFPRWKIILVVGTCLLGLWFALPNVLSPQQRDSLPEFFPTDTINLGLDLQGGVHLLWEVGVEDVVAQELEQLRSSVASELRKGGVRRFSRPEINGDVIRVKITNARDIDAAYEALRGMATPITTALGTVPDLEVSEAESGTLEMRYGEEAALARRSQVVARSIEIIRRRIDEMGTQEPTIQRQGEDRILVQVPGFDDPDQIKALVGTTARLTFHLVDTNISGSDLLRGRAPAGSRILFEEPEVEGQQAQPWAIRNRIMVDGADLTDAQPSFDQNGRPAVSFTFNARGGKMFADATRRNVGKPFAIVLDDTVVSAPVIQEPILGGSGIITGRFTVAQTTNMAILLRAGALPAPLRVLEERTVGPDLGADSVAAGEIAAIIGLIGVVVFITLSYGTFGVAANAALMINLILIGAVLSLLQAVLTLPGIAGIVLTIGMAVDANVLVFERIREELKGGKAPFSAVEAGYSKAYSTILDANITTFIAAVLLFQFGSGPVRGFAVTLAIGILTSVFTAVIVTRLMIATWLRRRRPAELSL